MLAGAAGTVSAGVGLLVAFAGPKTAEPGIELVGFLRELRRYIEHCERQDLRAAGQLELG